MTTRYTLHTDESGEFEGELSRGYRLIAGLILPEMQRGAVQKARNALLEIAGEVGGARHLGALHACAAKGKKEARDALTRRVVGAVFSQLDAMPQLVLLSHANAPPTGRGDRGILSVDFAANRYQRMLVELVRQSLEYVPGPEVGAVFDLELASRVFPVQRAHLPRLLATGYKQVNAEGDATPLVSVGSVNTLHAAIQTQMGEGWRLPRSSVRKLRLQSIARTKDPRYIAADFLANYAYRHFGGTAPEESSPFDFPGLSVTTLCYGPALEALSMAHDALREGDVAGSLDLLAGARQPATHDASVQHLLGEIGDAAAERLPDDPRLADRLLDRAERILEFRRYGLMPQAERLARVVLNAPAVGSEFVRRAHSVLGTAANHQGKHRLAARELEAAITSAKESTPSIELSLEICDLENRRAVSEMNVFRFDLDARVAPRLRLVDAMVRQVLGDAGRERVAGELAGTLAQAAVFAGDAAAARKHFETATRHLGEDHMQAAFRAHAAIQWDDESGALEAARQALGSSYGQPGYDVARGAQELRRPGRCVHSCLASSPFNAWLVLKLGASGWLKFDDAALERVESSLLAQRETHHPHSLIALDGGRLLMRQRREPSALKVWANAYARTRTLDLGPTLGAIRLQLAGELALAQIAGHAPPKAGRKRIQSWPRELTAEASQLLERHPQLAPHFNVTISALGSGEPSASAIRDFLGRFTFLYT